MPSGEPGLLSLLFCNEAGAVSEKVSKAKGLNKRVLEQYEISVEYQLVYQEPGRSQLSGKKTTIRCECQYNRYFGIT